MHATTLCFFAISASFAAGISPEAATECVLLAEPLPVYLFTNPDTCEPCRSVHKHLDELDAEMVRRIVIVNMSKPFANDAIKSAYARLKDEKGEIRIPLLATMGADGKVKAKRQAAGINSEELKKWLRENK